MNKIVPVVVLLACALMLSSCAKKKSNYDGWTAEQLYNEAKGALNRKNYSKAKEMYKALEARFPLGAHGQQALLDQAYLYYKSEDQDNAISTADRFIELYPQHKHVAYAYYIRGLASFTRGTGFVSNMLSLDESQRNMANKEESYTYMEELVEKFPDSVYTKDALRRMVHLRNNLAEHEVNVAQYYMRRGSYLAAANRGRFVISHYPGATITPEALVMMVRAYTALGLDSMADDAREVLVLNYPSHGSIAELEDIRVR